MREALITTLQDYQGKDFAEWPEEAQRRMMMIIQHYCCNDKQLFTEIVMTIEDYSVKKEMREHLQGKEKYSTPFS